MTLPDYPQSPRLADPKAWRSEEPDEAYDRLEKLVEAAGEAKVIDDLPATESEAKTGDYHVRARVIGERLWLLGYLAGNRRSARYLYNDQRDVFLAAVRRFQAECGLKVDSWCGEKTWNTLQRLVGFETEGLPTDWFEQDEFSMALQRAMQLRLSVFGLGTKPSAKFGGLADAAFKRFQHVLMSLDAIPVLRRNRYRKDSAKLLMHHDSVVDLVVKASREKPDGRYKFDFVEVPKLNRQRHQEHLRAFLHQLAKIELWLLGADVILHADEPYPVLGVAASRAGTQTGNHKTGEALQKFYHEIIGDPPETAREQAQIIRPEFFITVQTQDRGARQTGRWPYHDDATRKILREIESQVDVDTALDTGRSLGMRLWDGLKRIWNWFKKKIVKVVKFANNAFRAFYRYAVKAMQIFRRAARAFERSWKFYLRGGLQSHSKRSFALVDKDLDTRLLLDPADSARTGMRMGKRLRLFSASFLFSAQIVATLLTAVIHGALSQWARLALALVKNLSNITRHYRKLRAIEAQLAALPA